MCLFLYGRGEGRKDFYVGKLEIKERHFSSGTALMRMLAFPSLLITKLQYHHAVIMISLI